MKIVAQILHFNNSNCLLKVIESIEKQTYPVDKILIADNGSIEVHKQVLNTLSNKYEILWLLNNGVGAGHNHAWRHIINRYNPDYIWVLEHDAIPEPDCLEQMIKQKVEDNLVVYHPIEIDGLDYKNKVIFTYNSSGFIRVLDRTRLTNYKGGLSFNGLLLPVTVIEKVGYLNESYFFGREDIDFARRIYLEGGYVLRITNAKVFHNMHKDKKVYRFGKYEFLVPNISIVKEYYGYRNSCHDKIRDTNNSIELRLRHYLTILFTLLFKSNPLERIRIRNIALNDALNGKMGKVNIKFK